MLIWDYESIPARIHVQKNRMGYTPKSFREYLDKQDSYRELKQFARKYNITIVTAQEPRALKELRSTDVATRTELTGFAM